MDVAYPKHPKIDLDEFVLPFPDLPRLPKPPKSALPEK
jgi:hypothetical protein